MSSFLRTCSSYILFFLCVGYLFSPYVVLAQEVSTDWFDAFIGQFGTFVNTATPILIALAFLVFVWGLVVFISASGNESKIEEGRRKMWWGVIALFTIVSIWGILTILRTLTGVGNETSSNYPSWR